MEIEAFIERAKQRTLPTNPMARVRILAKELAEGAVENVWGISFYSFRGDVSSGTSSQFYPGETDTLNQYLTERWAGSAPSLALLVSNNYLRVEERSSQQADLYITRDAFDLLEMTEPASIFISYRREDSSAFALLVLARLKEAGLNAFLDLTIQPGANWRDHIQAEIHSRDHFILLLGGQTLSSEVVHQELQWALDAKKNIMPIWHNRYKYKSGDFNLDPALDRVLQDTHTIRVLEESALAYNNALIELLNRFGVTP